jgi:phosphomannomutase
MASDYQCPGEDHPISESVHLGRLASFYPACRDCPHREVTRSLGKRAVKQIERARHFAPQPPICDSDGIHGGDCQQLTLQLARQLAAAFGVGLRQHTRHHPQVVIAGDGRPLLAEFVAAVAGGLRWAGCQVIETGAATAALLTMALAKSGADGALLVGNPGSSVRTIGLKFWGPFGLPLPADQIIAIERLVKRGVDRPSRRWGTATRLSAEADYLAGLQDYFHALRPLKWVLDTGSGVVEDYARRLGQSVACELVLGRDLPAQRVVRGKRPVGPLAIETGPRERLRLLQKQVPAAKAHFGIWIDGDGEACALVDERGQEISAERLLLLLARHLVASRREVAVVVEQETSTSTRARLAELGATIHVSSAERAEMAGAVQTTGAVVGGGPSGRVWFATPLPCPDGLRTVALLLTVLIQSDWSTSEALEMIIAKC